eukprot:1190603-Prorocentrum_minimum.AAC.4
MPDDSIVHRADAKRFLCEGYLLFYRLVALDSSTEVAKVVFDSGHAARCTPFNSKELAASAPRLRYLKEPSGTDRRARDGGDLQAAEAVHLPSNWLLLCNLLLLRSEVQAKCQLTALGRLGYPASG